MIFKNLCPKTIALSLSLFILFLVPVRADEEVKVITATGEAVGNSPQAKEQALQRALRNAVEQGVGVYISSDSKVENYQLLEDKIYSKVKGYVKTYNILNETEDQGVYRVKIEAQIASETLKQDLSDLGILITQKGKPRTMIIITEEVEGQSWLSFYSGEGMAAQTNMEKIFLEKGFPLISKQQLEEIKEHDRNLSFDDSAKAAALGQQFGAELVIVGKAVSDPVDTGSAYGLTTHAFAGAIQAKAVKVDTAGIIAVDSSESKAWDQGRYVAARKSLQQAGEAIANKLIDQIAKKWRDEIYNSATFQLVVDHIGFEQLTELEQALQTMTGIQNAFRRSYAKNTAVIDVEMQGTQSQLVDNLSMLSLGGAHLEIVEVTANRIGLSLITNK